MATALQDREQALDALYAQDFDAEEITPPTPDAAPPEPEIVVPVFSEADLEAARAEGRAAGHAESERGVAATRVQMLGLIARGVADARTAGAEVAAEAADAIARTMLGALTACLPALCARHGAMELQALVRALLPALTEKPKITVRVNPLMIAAIATEINSLGSEAAEHVALLPSEQMAPGDMRLSWQDGAAVRDAGRIRAAVEDALAALGLLEGEMLHA